jgi:predicted RNA-binding protein YlqC (UPF0109 family)
MKEFVLHMARALVDHPQDMTVTEVQGKQTTILELRCHPKDAGRLIGRGGKTIAAMRTLLASLGAKEGRRAVLEMAE